MYLYFLALVAATMIFFFWFCFARKKAPRSKLKVAKKQILPKPTPIELSCKFARISTILASGLNNHGQLGRQFKNSYTFVPILQVPEKIVQVAAGNAHVMFLTSNGQVYGMGSNKYVNFVLLLFLAMDKWVLPIGSARLLIPLKGAIQEMCAWCNLCVLIMPRLPCRAVEQYILLALVALETRNGNDSNFAY